MRLQDVIRAEIDEYLEKSADEKVEMLACEETGYKHVEGVGHIYVIGTFE